MSEYARPFHKHAAPGFELPPFNDFNITWDALKNCDKRGIFYYNEIDNKMEYASFSQILFKHPPGLRGSWQQKGSKV